MTAITAANANIAYRIAVISGKPNPHSTPYKGQRPELAPRETTGRILPREGNRSGTAEASAEVWEITIMYKDTQKRWVDASLLGNYLQFMLAMARSSCNLDGNSGGRQVG